MRYLTWMEDTSLGITKPRSSELKAIDKALEAYEKMPTGINRAKLRIVVHNWMATKGGGYGDGGKPPWTNSARNQKGTVEDLVAWLYGSEKKLRESEVLRDLAELPFFGVEAFAENQARIEMQKERLEAVDVMFSGKKLKPKKLAVVKMGKDLKKKIRKVREKADNVQQASTREVKKAVGQHVPDFMPSNPLKREAERLVQEIIREVVSEVPEIFNEVVSFLNELVPNFISEAAGALVPYLSLGTSSAKAVKSLVNTTRQQIKLSSNTKYVGSVGKGDPEIAAQAILRLIERARNREAMLSGIYATDATVKGAAVAIEAAALAPGAATAVMTPLQGLATALAVLTLNIRAAARDVLEMKRANRIMMSGKDINASVFERSPLIGCYYIAASTHSTILNLLVEDIGEPGWMRDVEVMMKKHVIPLQATARSFIDESRFEIPELVKQQGAFKQNRFQKLRHVAKKTYHELS